jgi:hypothetical protein
LPHKSGTFASSSSPRLVFIFPFFWPTHPSFLPSSFLMPGWKGSPCCTSSWKYPNLYSNYLFNSVYCARSFYVQFTFVDFIIFRLFSLQNADKQRGSCVIQTKCQTSPKIHNWGGQFGFGHFGQIDVPYKKFNNQYS